MKRRIKSVGVCAIGVAVAAAFAPAYAHAALVVDHGRALIGQGDMLAAIAAHGTVAGGLGGLGLAALGIGSTTGAGNHAATSKWFRVAVEGATTDGRTIERDWITQMAATYNPDLYGARINCEHVRGLSPMAGVDPSPFGSYGDVLGLRAEQITDGPLKGKYGLFAQIQPTPALVTLTKQSQKIYTSIEVAPSFADTKQAYMIGLAITDSPASLGTEILQFAAGLGDRSPLAARKQHRDNLFTAAEETTIEFEAPSAAPFASVFNRVVELLGFVKDKGAADEKRFTDSAQAIEVLATFGKQQAATVTALGGRIDMLAADLKAEREAHAATAAELKALTETLSAQPGGVQRPAATGASSEAKTDC